MTEKKEKIKKSRTKGEINFEFAFYAPEANEVFLAGEFNHWDTQSLLMKKDKDGFWKTKIKLSPGRYEYKLFVDDKWVENIPGAELSPNLFGTHNFVVWVK
jgi:1,4-alpha-glucan branching enzyme